MTLRACLSARGRDTSQIGVCVCVCVCVWGGGGYVCGGERVCVCVFWGGRVCVWKEEGVCVCVFLGGEGMCVEGGGCVRVCVFVCGFDGLEMFLSLCMYIDTVLPCPVLSFPVLCRSAKSISARHFCPSDILDNITPPYFFCLSTFLRILVHYF